MLLAEAIPFKRLWTVVLLFSEQAFSNGGASVSAGAEAAPL